MESVLKKEHIFIIEEIKNKKEVLKKIVEIAEEKKYINNKENVLKAFLNREKQAATGMGDSVAIPHAIHDSITKTTIFIFLLKKNIKWKSIDNKNKAKFIFALLIPKSNQQNDHLKILSKIAEKLMSAENREVLETYNTNKIYNIFK